jgi:hypothetical protein
MRRDFHDLTHGLGIVALAIIVGLGLVTMASAQASGASGQTPPTTPPAKQGDGDTTRREVAAFDQYLDKHPEVAKELRENPNLINDPTWLSKHPALQNWLKNHPRAMQELKENPKAFMRRERQFEKHEGGEHRPPKGAAKKPH